MQWTHRNTLGDKTMKSIYKFGLLAMAVASSVGFANTAMARRGADDPAGHVRQEDRRADRREDRRADRRMDHLTITGTTVGVNRQEDRQADRRADRRDDRRADRRQDRRNP